MRVTLIILWMVLSTLCCAFSAQAGQTLAIIASPELNLKAISQAELALVYWRKKQYWSHGIRMHPLNFPSDSPIRITFSKFILGSTPKQQTDYWNGLYFHGVSPPHIIQSSEAAKRYVLETPGAIAYIDACDIDSRIQAVAWLSSTHGLSPEKPIFQCQSESNNSP